MRKDVMQKLGLMKNHLKRHNNININIKKKSQKSLCSIPGCDFICFGENETEQKNHFRVDHSDLEFTESSFIMINPAMAEAMDILKEIKEENKSLRT